jgi:Zn-finger nucleic acid-binding protein
VSENSAPEPAFVCPACGASNQCAVAAAGRFDVDCWCKGVIFDKAALERLPQNQRNKACLCPKCAGLKGERR